MKVYIDTNIYRSYVSATSDIKSLEKLKKLIEEGKVELVFPSQTKREFLKHFKEGIKQTLEKLKKHKTKVVIPNELKNDKYGKLTEEDKAITSKIDSLNTDLEKYRVQKISEFKKHINSVNKLLIDIFKIATFFESTDAVVMKAIVRYAKDLPPKKNDHKFGDAIIWETLKENIRREEVVIISFDPDFNENKGKNSKATIKKLLAQEWKKHSGKKITLYKSLGQFVNLLDKEDKVSKETIRQETMQANVFANPNSFVVRSPNSITLDTGNSGSSILSGGINAYSVLNTLNVGGSDSSVFVTPPSINGTSIFRSSVASGAPSASVFINPDTGNYVFPSSRCAKCGKAYTPSLTSININGWCNECSSGSNGLFI